MLGSFVAGAFDVAIYCVIIILVAVCIVWAFKAFGIGIDPQVYYWGRVLVILLCLAAIILFLLSLVGVVGYPGPHFHTYFR
jgi:predicted membrane protein